MRDEEIDAMEQVEDTYWWHVGRRQIISRIVRRFLPTGNPTILDVGCGTGRNLKLLGEFGQAWGVDNSSASLEAARRFGLDGRLSCARATLLPFADGTFDLVTALDVLEHLDDDAEGLAESWRVLAPGGVLLVAVPAYRFLWSEHDEFLGHRRRYVASELHAKVGNAGFDVLKRSYAITFAFPIILGFRLFRGLFPNVDRKRSVYVMLPEPLNAFFTRLVEFEARLMDFVSLPLGTSIFCVARKNEDPARRSRATPRPGPHDPD
jgi:SAM-dependent methyltransferase